MSRQHIDVTVHTSASREALWSLLADADTWQEWGPWDEVALERHGRVHAGGVGALRRYRRGRRVMIEEVVAFEPPRRFAYQLRSGLPMRGYHAEVLLIHNEGGGTAIRWQSSFEAAIPGTGWLLRLAFTIFIRDVARRLAGSPARPRRPRRRHPNPWRPHPAS